MTMNFFRRRETRHTQSVNYGIPEKIPVVDEKSRKVFVNEEQE